MALFRIEQPAVQAGLIAKEKKAFGVGIQTAERIDIFRKTEFSEGPVRRPVRGEPGKNPVGFVKGQKHRANLSAGDCPAKGSCPRFVYGNPVDQS